MKKWKNLSEETKVKLIYSGELIFFAILFLVFGILFFASVLGTHDTFLNIYKWITIFGAGILLADIMWGILSKKRRERICLLDKLLNLPVIFYNIFLDIMFFMNDTIFVDNYRYFIAPVFIYFTITYTFQGIYHFYYPIPGLFEEVEGEVPDENSSADKQEEKDDESK